MPKCFIIMPLTTRADLVSIYDGDEQHFIHVLDHLLVPSVEAAGFEPVRPIAEGSEIIHATIISKLIDADMVLCDMSGLNPNVFFELGIRTALNKPTCIVKDEVTKPVPFDTNIINYHTYATKLALWNIEGEKTRLTTHIKKSFDAEKPGNAMWRHFGLSHAAHLTPPKSGEDARIEYLTVKMDQLSKQIEQQAFHNKRTTAEDIASTLPLSNMVRAMIESGVTTEEKLAKDLHISGRALRNVIEGVVGRMPGHIQDAIANTFIEYWKQGRIKSVLTS